MKVSIFTDGWICYWVDYSKRKDCTETIEISGADFYKIKAGTHALERTEENGWWLVALELPIESV